MECTSPEGLGQMVEQAVLLAALLAPLLALGCVGPPGGARLNPYRDATSGDVDELLTLRNERVEVGLLPRVGGRVVLLRRPGGRNVLCSDPDLWHTAVEPVPEPAPDAGFKQYRGHVVWAGPQGEFWADQDFAPGRRERKSGWPPDPFLTYAGFQVAERQRDYVRLVGPESPVSGLQLTKEVRLKPDGTVGLKVTGVNIRERPVSKDLWSNTRLPGLARCYVPLRRDRTDLRIEAPRGGALAPLGHEEVRGYLTFRCREPIPEGKSGRRAKAFIEPRLGLVAAFAGDNAFLKQASLVPRDETHPDQAFVEVYNVVHRDPAQSLLELEMHGPYRTLQPGESMSFAETWRLLPYGGPDDPVSQAAFLSGLLQSGD